jgi:small-conductance mechanosensitive channel
LAGRNEDFTVRFGMRLKVVLMLLAGMQWATAGADPVATDVKPPGSAAGTPAGANAAANSPAPNQSVHVSVLTPEQLIELLDKTVDWYRTLGTQQQSATRASDLMIVYANKQTADQVVNLAIEIARASAELISSEASAEQSADSTVSQSFEQQRSRLAQLRAATQAEMDADRQKLATAPGNVRRDLEAKLPELQGELSMLDAQINMLNTMSEFVHQNNVKAANANALKAHIDAIAASVPTVTVNAAAPTITPAAASGSSASTAMPATVALQKEGTRSGIWDLLSEVLRLRAKIKAIDAVDARTAALATLFENINKAPLEQLKALSAQSEALAAQADNASSTTLINLRKQFDTLAWVFKQTSAILLPLSKESVLLQQYRHNLDNWRQFTRREYKDALRALGVRLGVLVGMLAVVFILAEVWRRAVLHYAREPRHRYQLLLIRTIVMWTTAVIIVALSFVTELSTFATFAGLLSAGVAVAMQSVLVSIVGYFFLIGKYGIRIGDKVQIGTVSGEVIDLGLVRMHLMELSQTGPLGPTGRVVAFANLIVFQSSGGLFKQLPGVDLSWHEITVTLPTVDDYVALKAKLAKAVEEALHDYREEIERQTRQVRGLSLVKSGADAAARIQMRIVDGHMQAQIGYPVHSKHATDIDERVSQAVLNVLQGVGAPAQKTP